MITALEARKVAHLNGGLMKGIEANIKGAATNGKYSIEVAVDLLDTDYLASLVALTEYGYKVSYYANKERMCNIVTVQW